VPTFYHIILLPADLPLDRLREIARRQATANKLQTCLVLAADRGIYFGLDGQEQPSASIPLGGHVARGMLKPCEAFPKTDECRERASRLDAFSRATMTGGYLLGDVTKGGHKASQEETGRLAGNQENGVPNGLTKCPVCGEWKGECLDPAPNFAGMVMRVSCLCDNDNFCARCGQPLYERKLNANFFNTSDGHIWHVPGFPGLKHRCADEA
jgi:hypothetical protein